MATTGGRDREVCVVILLPFGRHEPLLPQLDLTEGGVTVGAGRRREEEEEEEEHRSEKVCVSVPLPSLLHAGDV